MINRHYNLYIVAFEASFYNVFVLAPAAKSLINEGMVHEGF
jgi:hypothetical protein